VLNFAKLNIEPHGVMWTKACLKDAVHSDGQVPKFLRNDEEVESGRGSGVTGRLSGGANLIPRLVLTDIIM
jgi:hypothetical protein